MDEKQILRILIGEFREKLNDLKGIIPRDVQFSEAPNKIKVAMGMRRVGKTYFLFYNILKMLKDGINQK